VQQFVHDHVVPEIGIEGLNAITWRQSAWWGG
jgi:hypothetical protein